MIEGNCCEHDNGNEELMASDLLEPFRWLILIEYFFSWTMNHCRRWLQNWPLDVTLFVNMYNVSKRNYDNVAYFPSFSRFSSRNEAHASVQQQTLWMWRFDDCFKPSTWNKKILPFNLFMVYWHCNYLYFIFLFTIQKKTFDYFSGLETFFTYWCVDDCVPRIGIDLVKTWMKFKNVYTKKLRIVSLKTHFGVESFKLIAKTASWLQRIDPKVAIRKRLFLKRNWQTYVIN